MQLDNCLINLNITGKTRLSCHSMITMCMKSWGTMQSESQQFAFEIHATKVKKLCIQNSSHFKNEEIPQTSQEIEKKGHLEQYAVCSPCSFPPATSAPLAAQFISQSPKSPPPALTPYAYYPHMSSPCSRNFWKGLERRRWSAGGAAAAKVFPHAVRTTAAKTAQVVTTWCPEKPGDEMTLFSEQHAVCSPNTQKIKQGVVTSLPTPIIILLFKRGLRNRGHRHVLEVLCHLCLLPHQTHFSVYKS